ncbi:hypothetical protein ACIBBG_32160 [Micromonospora chersina]|uniref:hypothetical protein n=1 Tax=Micromonospora chersina TaxID=47854 RepID=UPI0037AEBCAC
MDRPLDIPGLAKHLGVSEDWVKVRVKQREIPFTRLPGDKLVRFTPEHVAAILAGGEQPALNGPLANFRPYLVTGPRPPAGPSTPPPPSGPATPSKTRKAS